MPERVTVELPEELARRARTVAAQTDRRFEDVLVDWLDRAGAEFAVESMPDTQILALCENQLEPERQEQLSDLLGRNREGQLQEADRVRLDELMGAYRRSLRRKAQAIRVAVARGLRPRLQ